MYLYHNNIDAILSLLLRFTYYRAKSMIIDKTSGNHAQSGIKLLQLINVTRYSTMPWIDFICSVIVFPEV